MSYASLFVTLIVRVSYTYGDIWQWPGPPDIEEETELFAAGETMYDGTDAHLYGSFDSGKDWEFLDTGFMTVTDAVMYSDYSPSYAYTAKFPGPGSVARVSVWRTGCRIMPGIGRRRPASAPLIRRDSAAEFISIS